MAFRPGTIAEAIFSDRLRGDGAAFVEPGGETLSYIAAMGQVARLSQSLTKAGVAPGDRVGFVSPRSPLGLTGFLAISNVAICCPLGARQREDEYVAAFDAMGVSTLVDGFGDRGALDAASSMGLRVLAWRAVAQDVDQETVARECSAVVRSIGTGPDLALVMRTSGTTAAPKLVGLSHANVIAAASAIRDCYGLDSDDLCFNMMPLYHVHGLISGGMSSLISGACQLCMGPLRPQAFADAYQRLQPTWFTGSPPVHLALRDYYRAAGIRPENRRLRFLRSSSAPFPAPAIEELEALFGAPLLENYGMTETASTVCSNLLPPALRKVGGVGRTIGAEIRIVDGKGSDVPQGEEGEILLKGPSVITAYLGSPEITAGNFYGSWLRTGDVGYFDEDGDLFVIGRTKELIKRGGESIYPGEIDNALTAHGDISEAVTFSIEHPTLGEELVAAVVPKEGRTPAERDLRAYLAGTLSTYKVPSAVLVVDTIPKNETGKVQRRDMRSAFARCFSPRGEPPGNETEAIILKAWRTVLGREDIGATDNVFLFGADPLRSATVADTMQAKLGQEVTAKQIFEYPTACEQARLVSGAPEGLDRRQWEAPSPCRTANGERAMNEQSMAAANAENDIKAVIKSYNEAVRGNDAEGFRRAFHPTAPIAQFQQRSGEIDVKTLDGFIEQIDGLHAKFGGAVEVSEDIQVDVSDGIASAHVPFRFQMGDKAFSGVNIFVLAVDGGRWRIMSKVYSL